MHAFVVKQSICYSFKEESKSIKIDNLELYCRHSCVIEAQTKGYFMVKNPDHAAPIQLRFFPLPNQLFSAKLINFPVPFFDGS